MEVTLPNDKCFEKTEDADGGEDSIKIILDDVGSIPDIHNEVTMNVEQEDITAYKSVDDGYSVDVLPEDKPKNKKAVDQLSKDSEVRPMESDDDLNSDTDDKPENSKVKEKDEFDDKPSVEIEEIKN